jgi:ribonuclease HII
MPQPACGIDEVGTGALAGPVVAAAVVLPPGGLPRAAARLVDDSKRLTAAAREAAAAAIRLRCAVGVGEAWPPEIAAAGLRRATMAAMERAVAALAVRPASALVDGTAAPALPGVAVATLVSGDRLSLSVAAASVVAKVHRDRLMRELAAVHPGYGWERNVGYGTAAHLAALGLLGPSPLHRAGFAPVRLRLEAEAPRLPLEAPEPP